MQKVDDKILFQISIQRRKRKILEIFMKLSFLALMSYLVTLSHQIGFSASHRDYVPF